MSRDAPETAEIAALINFFRDQMEATTGICRVLPRMQVPQDIAVTNSVVGMINTGTVNDANINIHNPSVNVGL